MARLLVVSRSMALALRVADVHQVSEHPADDLSGIVPGEEIDVVVLDVGDPAIAMQTLDQLREGGDTTPVMIVSGYQPEWTGLLTLNLPGVQVVPLPITRAALLKGIEALAGPTPAQPDDSAQPDQAPTRRADPFPVPEAPMPAVDPVPPAGDESAGDTWVQPLPPGHREIGEAPSGPDHERWPQQPAAAEGDVQTAPKRSLLGRRRPGLVPHPAGSSPRDLILPEDPASLLPAARPSTPRIEPPGVEQLVGLLLERVSELFGVTDTAQVLADEIVERADADAAAVLIPDDHLWRVAGGVGLRPLERRLVLDSANWLIAETALGGKALIIEDTDIVRPKLAGTPLAAWKHLLAVPIGDIRSTVVIGRGGEAGPFTDRDLSVLVGPVNEAAGLLNRALVTRRLARLLSPLRDLDPTSARPR